MFISHVGYKFSALVDIPSYPGYNEDMTTTTAPRSISTRARMVTVTITDCDGQTFTRNYVASPGKRPIAEFTQKSVKDLIGLVFGPDYPVRPFSVEIDKAWWDTANNVPW